MVCCGPRPAVHEFIACLPLSGANTAADAPAQADGPSENAGAGAGPPTGPGLLSQSAADPALRATVGKLFWEWIGICNGKMEGSSQTLQQQALEFIGKLQVRYLLLRTELHTCWKGEGCMLRESVCPSERIGFSPLWRPDTAGPMWPTPAAFRNTTGIV